MDKDDKETGKAGSRNHVAEAESKERRAAQVQVGIEAGARAGDVYGGTGTVLHHPETYDEADGPDTDQDQ